ncbi:MAG: urease accessory protein UreD [Candidatus Acidiferrales bacterium]
MAQTQEAASAARFGASLAGRVDASLSLGFERRETSGATVLSEAAQSPPLRVIRAFPTEDQSALVHLHNVSGGVLGGDRLALSVRVGYGASAQLTTTGATRVYRSRGDNLSAIQVNEIAVEENGLLEYVPDAIIPFAGARFQQQTRIQLSAGAGLFWWEILAPGREARGECFAYSRVGLRTEIHACGRLIAFENVDLEPAKIHMGAIARLGVYRYWITFYFCRAGVASSKWLAAEAHMRETAAPWCKPGEMLWSVSTLPADGLAIRGLARRGREILPALQALWSSAKVFLYGRAPILPRKVQ